MKSMKRVETRFNRLVESPRSRRDVRVGYDREGALLLRGRREAVEAVEAVESDTPAFALRLWEERVRANATSEYRTAERALTLIEDALGAWCPCDDDLFNGLCGACRASRADYTSADLDAAHAVYVAALEAEAVRVTEALAGL